MFTEDDLRSVVGRRFPGGIYTVEPWRAWLLADAALAEPPSLVGATPQVAHPLFAWMAAIGAMGITFDELFAWFGSSAADGPLFGEQETTLHRPISVGTTCRVAGGISSAERKAGRRIGTFDVVGYELDVHDATTGEHLASVWNSIVFPRRDS